MSSSAFTWHVSLTKVFLQSVAQIPEIFWDSCPLDDDYWNEFMRFNDSKEVDTGEVEGEAELLPADLIHEGLKLAASIGQNLLTHDPNTERALKFLCSLV
ncbi:hypothetical protein TNCV_2099471 [Trichonephila clavipes]|nr:hypothetical protein TNCV_2099471 [Trichonephila clavipes]